MQKITSFQIAKAAAQKKEDQAAKEFGIAQQYYTAQKKQYDELLQYQQEYLSQYTQLLQTGTEGKKIQQFNQFLSALNQAITLQQQALHKAQANVSDKKNIWQNYHHKTSALQRLIEQQRQQQQQQQSRVEQKLLDEQAMTLLRHHKPVRKLK